MADEPKDGRAYFIKQATDFIEKKCEETGLPHWLHGGPLDIDDLAAKGMLRKADLEDGAYYLGVGRGVFVAKWDAGRMWKRLGHPEERLGTFVYTRQKFNLTFNDTMEHPEDDCGFAVFVPIDKIDAEHVHEFYRVKEGG